MNREQVYISSGICLPYAFENLGQAKITILRNAKYVIKSFTKFATLSQRMIQSLFSILIKLAHSKFHAIASFITGKLMHISNQNQMVEAKIDFYICKPHTSIPRQYFRGKKK